MIRKFTDLSEAEKYLFDTAEVLWTAQQTINRYADEAGHGQLALGFTRVLPRWEDGAYGNAQVAMEQILRALFGEDASDWMSSWVAETGERLADALDALIREG